MISWRAALVQQQMWGLLELNTGVIRTVPCFLFRACLASRNKWYSRSCGFRQAVITDLVHPPLAHGVFVPGHCRAHSLPAALHVAPCLYVAVAMLCRVWLWLEVWHSHPEVPQRKISAAAPHHVTEGLSAISPCWSCASKPYLGFVCDRWRAGC